MRPSYSDIKEQSFLEDLLLSDAFPVSESRRQYGGAASRTMKKLSTTQEKARRSQARPAYQLQPPSNPSPGLFPSHAAQQYPSPTMRSEEQLHQQFHARFHTRDANTDQQQEIKRREMGWNTSFPAEYARSPLAKEYRQTAAFPKQQSMFTDRVPSRQRRESRGTTGSLSQEELQLRKHVTLREGLLAKLEDIARLAHQPDFSVSKGNELLHLLLQLRDESVLVMAALADWHSAIQTPPNVLWYEEQNYCVKMVSDLNFLADIKSLGQILGVQPTKMAQNPFMMPSPIPDRDFKDTRMLPIHEPPRISSSDPLERVAEAEKYLVWCLVHVGAQSSPSNASSSSLSYSNDSAAADHKDIDRRTWQQRAEAQLQVLSMPLEAPQGRNTQVMDSSWMMKRKGYLPSLPQSPAKTLTELMDNVHHNAAQVPLTNVVVWLRAHWEGVEFSASSADLEVLGAMDSPPQRIVVLVAASVLILLSPSDRLPKDLSWSSCQKMLSNGVKLVERMKQMTVDSVPPFKWQALVPFLQNDHFQPRVLANVSRAASSLCAWVLTALAEAQEQAVMRSRQEEDRRLLLDELEIEDEEPQEHPSRHPYSSEEELAPVRPTSKGKRVSIGNAEVLFINENEPVWGSPRGPRDISSPALQTKKPQSVLLRTSPWTFHSVTYFVSFFLEQKSTVLSIKLYEPMSSVESQMYVSKDDLQADFGARAVDMFDHQEFRPLCDLILSQLDNVMRGGGALPMPTPRQERKPTDVQPIKQQDELQTKEDMDAASVRIQCVAPQHNDRNELRALKQQQASATTIQCAARQQLARKHVKHVRFQQQQREQSATAIQSKVRQNQAAKEVSRMRLMQRQSTGLAPRLKDSEDEEHETEPAVVESSRPDSTERPETAQSYASEQFDEE